MKLYAVNFREDLARGVCYYRVITTRHLKVLGGCIYVLRFREATRATTNKNASTHSSTSASKWRIHPFYLLYAIPIAVQIGAMTHIVRSINDSTSQRPVLSEKCPWGGRLCAALMVASLNRKK